jgi:hypothetical protein
LDREEAMTNRSLATVSLVLLAAMSAACINVTSEAVSKDEQARTYVRRQPASKDEPRIAVSGSGTRLVITARRQPLCTEETVEVSERVEVTTTKPAADKDKDWLGGCWIAGVLGVGTGVVSLAISPALSNKHTTDDQGKDAGSDRQAAYMVGLAGLLVGVPTLLAAIIDQSRLGTSEKRGAPSESVTATRDVPCGDGHPVPNAQITVSGSVESAVAGQTNSQGQAELDLRSLPNFVREEIANLGHFVVAIDGQDPARAEWSLPEATVAILRNEAPTQGPTSGSAPLTPLSALASPISGVIHLEKCEVDDGRKSRMDLAMGNGNGQIDREEMVEITCQLKNTASTEVGDFRLEPVSGNSDVILTKLQPLKLPVWLSQAVHSVTFGLSVKKKYDLLESAPLPVSIRVTQNTGRVVADVPLGLRLGGLGR